MRVSVHVCVCVCHTCCSPCEESGGSQGFHLGNTSIRSPRLLSSNRLTNDRGVSMVKNVLFQPLYRRRASYVTLAADTHTHTHTDTHAHTQRDDQRRDITC